MPRVVAEVRAAELHDVLPPEQRHLPVEDRRRHPLAHRDAGRFECVERALVERRRSAAARIDEQPHANPGVEARNDVLDVVVVLHEPEPDVDLLSLVVDQAQQLGAAVLERRVAELVHRGGSPCGGQRQHHDDQGSGVAHTSKGKARPMPPRPVRLGAISHRPCRIALRI